ncbi:MAG TPA: HlyD family efflux transporter periplasmic adaptor subunit [Gammaproteobacteria bacterium]|nr:HlyD family efflux transporter periplasmic adaptor subunit [Gammaproteobacteria bacterium]
MRLKRKAGMLFTLLAVLAALLWGFWPRPLLVDAAPVVRAPMEISVDEEGRTRVKDRFLISAPVAGVLRRIRFEVGDCVHSGQPLATLEPTRPPVLDARSRAQAEARVAAARAAVKSAREKAAAAAADAEFARAEYRRRKELRSRSAVAEEALDMARSKLHQAEATLRSARFAVDVARFELEAARTALEYTAAKNGSEPEVTVEIRSPVDGCVLAVYHKSEGAVSPGDPVIEVGDPAALEVAVDVLSADAVRIRPGTRVVLEHWGGKPPLEAVVRTVEPVAFTKVSALGVEEQRVWVIADIVSPREQWQTLGDRYRVDARFILWQGSEVLQIPDSALFRHDDHWAVFAIRDGRARLQAVTVGHRSGLEAEVISGLKVGEQVINHPDDRIHDGTRVAPR